MSEMVVTRQNNECTSTFKDYSDVVLINYIDVARTQYELTSILTDVGSERKDHWTTSIHWCNQIYFRLELAKKSTQTVRNGV